MAKDNTGASKTSLSDDDIATYARRSGPAAAGAHTDSDAHTDTDTATVATDHDTAKASDDATTDKDT